MGEAYAEKAPPPRIPPSRLWRGGEGGGGWRWGEWKCVDFSRAPRVPMPAGTEVGVAVALRADEDHAATTVQVPDLLEPLGHRVEGGPVREAEAEEAI